MYVFSSVPNQPKKIIVKKNEYIETFSFGNITVFSLNDSIVSSDMTNSRGLLLNSSKDKFVIVSERRDASEKEIAAALNTIMPATVPKIDIASACVRQLSGIKPKRILKSKKVTVEEEESDLSDISSSLDDNEDVDDEDEENAEDDDNEECEDDVDESEEDDN